MRQVHVMRINADRAADGVRGEMRRLERALDDGWELLSSVLGSVDGTAYIYYTLRQSYVDAAGL